MINSRRHERYQQVDPEHDHRVGPRAFRGTLALVTDEVHLVESPVSERVDVSSDAQECPSSSAIRTKSR